MRRATLGCAIERFQRKSQGPDAAARQGREARFRLNIVAAYNYTCALTRYRLTTIGGASIVDAARIHPFSDSRNNDPRNGLALCKNAHWLFDNGLWTLTDDYQVSLTDGSYGLSNRPAAINCSRNLTLPDELARRGIHYGIC